MAIIPVKWTKLFLISCDDRNPQNERDIAEITLSELMECEARILGTSKVSLLIRLLQEIDDCYDRSVVR